MHSRPFKYRSLRHLARQFDQFIANTLQEYNAAGDINKMPEDPAERSNLDTYYGNFYKLPRKLQEELELINQTIATVRKMSLKPEYKGEIVTGAMLLVAGRNPQLAAGLEKAIGISKENVMHKETHNSVLSLFRYFRFSEKVRLSSFMPLDFDVLADNFYFDVLDKEYAKYKVSSGNNVSFNIPAERRSQLKLVQNTVEELRAATMSEEDKVMILMGAMLYVQNRIYDSYWRKTNVNNSEVYKNTPAAMGVNSTNALDGNTEKAALMAFRNYLLARAGDENDLLEGVEAGYNLSSKDISSYISNKVNPQLSSTALTSAQLKKIKDVLPPRQIKAEDRTMVENIAAKTKNSINNVYNHYNFGLFQDVKAFNKANLKKTPKVEEKNGFGLKLK